MIVEILREFADRETGEARLPGQRVEYTNERAMELYWGGWVSPVEEEPAAEPAEAPAPAKKGARKK